MKYQSQMEPFLGQITREVARNRIQQFIEDEPNAETVTAERLQYEIKYPSSAYESCQH